MTLNEVLEAMKKYADESQHELDTNVLNEETTLKSVYHDFYVWVVNGGNK